MVYFLSYTWRRLGQLGTSLIDKHVETCEVPPGYDLDPSLTATSTATHYIDPDTKLYAKNIGSLATFLQIISDATFAKNFNLLCTFVEINLRVHL